ncbi:MAG: hypothetical protein ACO289_11865, partial [Prochlorococcaceae cyanobacterium]
MPQLNFMIPADLLDRIDAAKPDFLDRKGFICLLLAQQLDKPSTLGAPSAAGAPSSSSIEKPIEEELKPIKPKTNTRACARGADPYKAKAISVDLVPDDLLDCQQLLPEWWAVKKGVRSEGVWRRVCGKLRAWTPEQRRDALERAIASGWGDVFEPHPARASSQVVSASGVPMTASEQIAASALRKIQAM